MDGTLEAGPGMKDLLERVRRGETLTITEGGRPVARLVPTASAPRPRRSEEEVGQLVAGFQDFAARHSLGGLSLRDLIDEGKR